MPIMLARLKAEGLDLVIGSRYAAGAGTIECSAQRLLLSRLGIRSARWLLPRGELRDLLNGFVCFAARCWMGACGGRRCRASRCCSIFSRPPRGRCGSARAASSPGVARAAEPRSLREKDTVSEQAELIPRVCER